MKATPTLSSDNNKTRTAFERYVMADILRTARELGHVVRIKPGQYQITAPDRSFTLSVATR